MASISPNRFQVSLCLSDKQIAGDVEGALEKAGYLVSFLSEEALSVARVSAGVVLSIIDAESASRLGPTGVEALSSSLPEMQIAVLGEGEKIAQLKALIPGSSLWYLSLPFDSEELLSTAARACIFHELTRENQRLRASVSAPNLDFPLIANSPSMQAVLERIHQVSSSRASVLLLGESGTGKTRLARYIHRLRGAEDAPFVAMSCAAIPRDLLEAEFFGYEKGAFTGAHQMRQGAAELSDGGTLFLDEIGELPLDLQPKLLTFLQDRQVRRLGSAEQRKVDVQIIAATNQNLESMVTAREFRDDLFFRINVLSIAIPPLRQRKEDIAELTEHILRDLAEQRKIPPFVVSPEAAAALSAYDWPGNIRQLENVLERASVFSVSRQITPADLSLPEFSAENHKELGSLSGLTLAELERKAILDTLHATNGNKAEAARLLGISTKSVYNKLARYGLDSDAE